MIMELKFEFLELKIIDINSKDIIYLEIPKVKYYNKFAKGIILSSPTKIVYHRNIPYLVFSEIKLVF